MCFNSEALLDSSGHKTLIYEWPLIGQTQYAVYMLSVIYNRGATALPRAIEVQFP